MARKVDSELALRMTFGSEFQTFGAATQNASLPVSVRVHGTERRGASVDRRDRVVTWRLGVHGTSVIVARTDDSALEVLHIMRYANLLTNLLTYSKKLHVSTRFFIASDVRKGVYLL